VNVLKKKTRSNRFRYWRHEDFDVAYRWKNNRTCIRIIRYIWIQAGVFSRKLERDGRSISFADWDTISTRKANHVQKSPIFPLVPLKVQHTHLKFPLSLKRQTNANAMDKLEECFLLLRFLFFYSSSTIALIATWNIISWFWQCLICSRLKLAGVWIMPSLSLSRYYCYAPMTYSGDTSVICNDKISISKERQ